MRFLLDENVSYRVASHLKAAGHDAVHVSEIGLTSADDLVVLARARDEGRVLVSGDHDFVQMLFASGATYPSLVLVREVESMSSAELAVLLLAALPAGLADLLPAGAIATLTPDRARVRPLPLRPDIRA
jgi:predicted nuclease of predicted toxin-antitoxin system